MIEAPLYARQRLNHSTPQASLKTVARDPARKYEGDGDLRARPLHDDQVGYEPENGQVSGEALKVSERFPVPFDGAWRNASDVQLLSKELFSECARAFGRGGAI